MPEERHLVRIVIRNFINSFRLGRHTQRGTLIGTDYIGNKYFEIAPDPSIGKRKPKRWYDPAKGNDFQVPVPAEWDSWLRMRRPEPPTEEEISQNLAIAQMKKENAAELEAKRLAEGGMLPTPITKGPQSFPKYEEYTTGDPQGKQKS